MSQLLNNIYRGYKEAKKSASAHVFAFTFYALPGVLAVANADKIFDVPQVVNKPSEIMKVEFLEDRMVSNLYNDPSFAKRDSIQKYLQEEKDKVIKSTNYFTKKINYEKEFSTYLNAVYDFRLKKNLLFSVFVIYLTLGTSVLVNTLEKKELLKPPFLD